jgi:hypothetical protein
MVYFTMTNIMNIKRKGKMAFTSIIGTTYTYIAIVSFNSSTALISRLPVTPGSSDDQLAISYD